MSRIALVDDDRNILTSVAMTLEAEGFEVETYNDGQSAFEAFSRFLEAELRGVQGTPDDGTDRSPTATVPPVDGSSTVGAPCGRTCAQPVPLAAGRRDQTGWQPGD